MRKVPPPVGVIGVVIGHTDSLALRLPGEFAALGGERVLSRLRSLSRLIGREPVMLMG